MTTQVTFQADDGNHSDTGRRRYSLARKLVRSSLMAAVAGCTIAALAGPAQAAPVPPQEPNLIWQLTHPGCPQCGLALGANQWIDPAGSLRPGTLMQLQVKGTLQGKPAAGATVFLSDHLIGQGAMATVGGIPLGAAPQPFRLNAHGRLAVTYRSADAQAGPLGTDVLTAAGTATGKHAVTASYNYDQPAAYMLAPVPVAPAGSLAAGQSAPAQLAAIDATGSPVGGAFVADWEDDFCGTWWPVGPHHLGPQVGSAADPTYAFANAAGQVNFSFISNGSAGGTNVLSVEGVDPAQPGPVTTYYQC